MKRHNSLRKELVRDFFASLDSTLSTVESEVKEMGSCNGHQETDAEYAKRIAQLEGKPCNCGSEVKEMGSCRGHQETDAEYEMRVAKLKAVGKPCNCGSEVN